MFKQLVVLLLVAGVVLCNDAPQAEEAITTTTAAPGAKSKAGLGKSLLDLAIIGSKNVKRTYDESKPTFNFIKKNIGKKINTLRKNPTVQKGLDTIANNPTVQKAIETSKKQAETIGKKIAGNQHVQAASAKAQPVIEQGLNKVNGMINEADKKGRTIGKKVLDEHNARQEELKNNVQEGLTGAEETSESIEQQ